MLDNFSLNADDLWNEIEPEVSKLRLEKWIDPILVDRFDALLNHYNGNISTDNTTAVLGKLESLTTMLSMESYYRTRQNTQAEKSILLKLNENLLLLKQVLNSEQIIKEKAAFGAKPDLSKEEDRFPNEDGSKEKVESLYKKDKKDDK